jgi:hypothetical protein
MGEKSEADVMEITGDDAAFILGAGGKTKAKLAQVSGANLYIVEKASKVILEIYGTPQQRARAKKYCKFVMVQRVKPVTLDPKDHPDDLTIVLIPYDAVSFVTGKGGRFLRMVEEEFGTLLFFLGSSGKATGARGHMDTMQLAIFGDTRSRRGSELKIMTATEMKFSNHFTKHLVGEEHISTATGFDTDWRKISDDDYSYALGKGGSTRRKLSRASGCIVEYVGQVAYFAGTKKERDCAREYLDWVLMQRVGPVNVDYATRDDCTHIMVPAICIGYITGHRGVSLRQIEEETKTFCFFEGAVQDDHENPKPLLIFGTDGARKSAETLVWEKIIQKSGEDPWEAREKGKSKKGDKKGKGKGKGKDKDHGKGAPGAEEGWKDARDAEPTMVVDNGEQVGKTIINITGEDAAFVMGPQGRTKRKVAQASGTHVEIRSVGGQDRLTIEGTEKRRKQAEMYIRLVMAQRLGPVHLEDESTPDLTIVHVPGEAVSFVTGKQGSFLRLMEEEFGALLFFLDFNMTNHMDRVERLAIFGPMRNRRGTELKVMAAVEMKRPGTFTKDIQNYVDPSSGFGTDTLWIEESDYSYALGKQGATRKNIVRSTGCLVEYVGFVAFLSGTKEERNAAREYLLWLFDERKNRGAHGDAPPPLEGKGKGLNGHAGKGKGEAPEGPPAPSPAEDDEGWGDWGGASDNDEEPAPAPTRAPNAFTPAPFVSAGVPEELLDLPAPLLDEDAWPDLGMKAPAPGGGKSKKRR